MAFLVSNHSGYPRIGDAPEFQKLRRALEAVARGDEKPEVLSRARLEMTRWAIQEQQEAGAEIVTDGQVGWYDGISHFALNFDGVVPGSIFRFFDTNFLIRQPHARGKVRWRGTLTAPDAAAHARISERPFKAVLTGPVTLARHTIRQTDAYADARDLAADYAAGLLAEAREIFATCPKNIAWLQIDEPSILSHPEDLPVLKGFLSDLAQMRPEGTTVMLATYFNDAAPLYERLLELPVGGLVWDLTYSEVLSERIARGFSKVLGLGIADARNTRLEKPEDIARAAERLSAKARGEVHLLPSASLEHLPRTRAREKLAVLARARAFLEG